MRKTSKREEDPEVKTETDRAIAAVEKVEK
jgi:hypothetical protein